MFSGKGNKFSIDKCAYILVYEKAQKKPISITFTPDNLHEKDLVMQNITTKPEEISVQKLEDGTEKMQIGFYDFKPYVPGGLMQLIKQDNFKYSIEQHVYSKEFLTFINSVTEFKEVGPFNPFLLQEKIFKGPVAEDTKQAMVDCLDSNLRFLIEVFAKTEESVVNFFNLGHRKIRRQFMQNDLYMSRKSHANPERDDPT